MDWLDQIIVWLDQNIVPIGVFFASLLAFYIIRGVLIQRLVKLAKRTKNDLDDLAVDILRTIRLPFAIVASLVLTFWAAGFNLAESLTVSVIFAAVVTYQFARAVGVLFHYAVKKFGGEEAESKNVQGFKTIINILIWIGGALFIMTILGYNVTSIVAGLGIGGIAVALAAQNILADVFSSFSIYFDRPFSVGDYIVVGDHDGTVEKIGLKTTRIRSLRGEEVIISNRELTEGVVENFGRLERRRVLMVLGLEYETPNEKLKKIPSGVKKIIESVKNVDFERIYFKDFGESTLDFELTYYVNSSEFNEFVAARHEVNLRLKDWLEKEGISLAYPTRMVYEKRI
ncbi:mechanosensitive ion channel [Patescibacteria group bacterium]|nr:mechanosensitive ion channel [Patescibacteria group bacterium]